MDPKSDAAPPFLRSRTKRGRRVRSRKPPERLRPGGSLERRAAAIPALDQVGNRLTAGSATGAQRREIGGKRLNASDVVVLGQSDRPAILEGPEIHDDDLEPYAGFPMAVLNRNLEAGPVVADHQVAGIEAQEIEL